MNDITIVGGGIIGLMCAARLSLYAEDLEITIIQDKAPVLNWKADELPGRVSAINRFSQRLFETLGLWELVLQEATPYYHMLVWDKESGGQVAFDSMEVEEPDLGHIATNRILQKVLWQYLSSRPQVCLKTGEVPLSFKMHEAFVALELEKSTIQSRLLIGADGAASWVRRQLGFECYEQNYGHSALTVCVHLEKPHAYTAYQCFSDGEILAFLPLKDPHQASIVWSASPQRAEHLKQMPFEAFNAALMNAIEGRLGQVACINERLTFPLSMRHSKSYVRDRVALIGDAIHTIHPLAGQGLNLGLQDAICLADFIKKAHEQRRDIGGLATLRRYERARVGENWKMIAAMDGLKRIFCHPVRGLLPFRKFGMKHVDQSRLIKKYFIREALG